MDGGYNSIVIGNAISAIGALLLFWGFFEIAVRGREISGLTLSGVGSFVMCFAFYILNSPAFLLLNVIWMLISIHGYRSRGRSVGFPSQVERNSCINLAICALLVFPSAALIVLGELNSVSWGSILIMLVSYLAFSAERMPRVDYICFQVISNFIAVFYMYSISNYISIAQIVITIGISVYSIIKTNKARRVGLLEVS